LNETDTICALSTPAGPGGIAVIRLSGAESRQIFFKVFTPAHHTPFSERYLYYGRITDGQEAIDEAMGVFFNAPRSYTGEDMAELHFHGGSLPVSRVLRLLTDAGARLAQPGEFTKRAFINGKMDLSRAEAVMDYISASSEAGAKAAQAQLQGQLQQKISSLQDHLTNILAQIEAVIEYPDEDMDSEIEKPVIQAIEACKNEVGELVASYAGGRILREGYYVTIAGKPNAGKSSLFNALAERNKAIVTEIPGTTRDVIEELISIRGIPVRLMDTAGLRKSVDIVESIGISRANEAVRSADLILLVIDLAEGVTPEDIEIFKINRDFNLFVVLNKSDVGNKEITTAEAALFAIKKIFYVSALTGEGMDGLKEAIYHAAMQDEKLLEGIVVTSERHKNLLSSAGRYLSDALDAYASGLMLDCLSIDIRAAWNDLGQITGMTVSEEIIDRIFSTFCLGK
jgi:tRNA modification GTPase